MTLFYQAVYTSASDSGLSVEDRKLKLIILANSVLYVNVVITDM